MSKSKRDCPTLQTVAGCSGKPMVGRSVGERTMRERVRLHGDGIGRATEGLPAANL